MPPGERAKHSSFPHDIGEREIEGDASKTHLLDIVGLAKRLVMPSRKPFRHFSALC